MMALALPLIRLPAPSPRSRGEGIKTATFMPPSPRLRGSEGRVETRGSAPVSKGEGQCARTSNREQPHA